MQPRDRLLVAAMVGYAFAIALWVAIGMRTGSGQSLGRLLAGQLLTILAGVFAWRVAQSPMLDHGTRRFWLAVWASQAAELVLAVTTHLAGIPGARAVATMAPLIAQGFLLVGLLQWPSAPRSNEDRIKLALDGATVIVGGLLLLWFDLFAVASHIPRTEIARYTAAHIVALGDVVLILVASVLWRRTALQQRAHVLVILALALLVRFLANVATVVEFARWSSAHDWTAISAPISAACVAAAAWMAWATMSERRRRATGLALPSAEGTSLIPYAAVLPGFCLLLKAAHEQGTQPLVGLSIGTVILATLAFARQVAATRHTMRVLAESTARIGEARFTALVQHSSDVITIVDPDGTIRYASPSMSTVLGHDPNKLVSTSLFALMHPDDVPGATQFLGELARYSRSRTNPRSALGTLKREWRIAHANGDWMTVDNVGTNLLAESVIGGLVLNSRDVTEQSVMKEQYMHQAFHDPLTDLANRSLFLYQVSHALTRAARKSYPVSVLFLDLDNFKTVNDSLGHAAGDRLLVEAARRLSLCVRDCDLIARLGGDEFALLVEDAMQESDVRVIADRIATTLANPFVLGGKEVFVSASIGLSRSVAGETSDELVRNADVAMYVAKTRGKGQCVVFEPQMHTAALERLVVEADLRRAIEHEEFFLQYQPIVLLATGEVIGAEALVRWCCRDRGTVPPGVFIPIAEETGMITAIGKWVLRRACRMAQQWVTERGHPMRITVNLSGRQLQEPGIVDDVRDALAESGLDPRHLVLEITESMLMHNTELALARLTALKALGVSLAIDDFGTGYSSLSYLQRYPIDILKIDKAFVDVIDKGGEGPVLANAIVALGKTLRMNTVAEGIESEAQREHLLALGCELGQGYLFARPLDAEDFWDILVTRGARSYDTGRGIREHGAQAA
jgi:diguanylate cyclase (GGDEF)-like protein/PAS domain S-box-containing protein